MLSLRAVNGWELTVLGQFIRQNWKEKQWSVQGRKRRTGVSDGVDRVMQPGNFTQLGQERGIRADTANWDCEWPWGLNSAASWRGRACGATSG